MPIRIIEDPMYQLLRDENVKLFNEKKQAQHDFSDCDFRGLDLRGLDASGINLEGAYFRNADLRGIDFRQAKIEGVSIAGAQISGCYFPKELSADEIELSVNRGTRMRYN